MKFDTNFDKDAFDMKKNMTSAQLEAPVMAEVQDEGFAVKYPEAINGMNLTEEKEIATEKGERIILTYEGTKSFTLVQEKAEVVQTSVSTNVNGEPVDLGYTVGAMTGNTIAWTFEGVDYMLASKDLTQEEMIEVARSVGEDPVK